MKMSERRNTGPIRNSTRKVSIEGSCVGLKCDVGMSGVRVASRVRYKPVCMANDRRIMRKKLRNKVGV